jgi:hypothetical protein
MEYYLDFSIHPDQIQYHKLLWLNKNAVNFPQHKKILLNICQ